MKKYENPTIELTSFASLDVIMYSALPSGYPKGANELPIQDIGDIGSV